MGYHLTTITKGELGRLSKLQEELEECLDAEAQGNRIMLLVELSDLIGATEAYLEKNFPDITLVDLINMKDATVRAFKTGHRK